MAENAGAIVSHAQKETPTSSSNYTAGVNTLMQDAIVHDGTASINTPAQDHVRELAQIASAGLLSRAAMFASTHAERVLWHRQLKVGPKAFLVRLEYPGVLRVYDPADGSLLAESVPGKPETLQKR